LDKIPFLFDKVSYRISEKEGSSVKEYSYTTPTNLKDKIGNNVPAW